MSALREILASFFVEVNDEELLAAGKHVEGFIGKMRAVIPVMTEAFAVGAMAEFVAGTVEAGAHVYDLAQKLGLGTTELQQFQFAAKLTGVEGETAAHSLAFLNRTVGDAVTGNKEAQETFAKLHVPLKDLNGKTRETSDVLMDVSDALARLPDQQTRAAYATKLFSREGAALLPVLAGGSEKLREVYGEFQELGGGMSEDFVRQSKETQDEIDKIKFGLEGIKVRIVAMVLPAVLALTNKVRQLIGPVIEWMEHTHALQHGMELLAGILSGKMVFSLIKMARVLGLLKSTAKGTLLAFAEFAIPIALFGALYLMFDDLMTLMEGGDSEIGHLLETLGGVEAKNEFVKELRDLWNELKVSLADVDWGTVIEATLTAIVGTMYELIEAAKLVIHWVKGIGELGGNAASWLVAKVTGNKGMADAAEKQTGKDFNKDFGQVSEDFDAMVNPSEHWKQHPAAQAPPGVDVAGDRAAWKAAMAARDARRGNGLESVAPPEANMSYAAPSVAAPGAGGGGGDTHVGQLVVHVEGGKNPDETGKRVAQSAATELERNHRDAAQNLKRM